MTAHRGAVSQSIRKAMPARAPPQTPASTAVLVAPCSSSKANGVYVPAINTRIIEWSSRRMIARALGCQVRR